MLKLGNFYISFGRWRFKLNTISRNMWQVRIGWLRISYKSDIRE